MKTNYPLSLALAQLDGSLRSNNKADLTDILQANVDIKRTLPENFPVEGVQQACRAFGSSWTEGLTAEILEDLEQFTCRLYGCQCSSINEARRILFCLCFLGTWQQCIEPLAVTCGYI